MKGTTVNTNPSGFLAIRDKQRLWQIRVGLFLAAFLCATAIIVFELPSDMGSHAFRVGEPSPRTFFSPFEISYINERATETLRREKGSQAPQVFELQNEATGEIKNKIARLFEEAAAFLKIRQVNPSAPEPVFSLDISRDSFKVLLDGKNFQEAQKALGLLQEKIGATGDVHFLTTIQQPSFSHLPLPTSRNSRQTRSLPWRTLRLFERPATAFLQTLPIGLRQSSGLGVSPMSNDSIRPTKTPCGAW